MLPHRCRGVVAALSPWASPPLRPTPHFLRGPIRPASYSAKTRHDDDRPPIRLSKRMSELDLCSRREADALIAAGRVTVCGSSILAVLGAKVDPSETDIAIVTASGEEAASPLLRFDWSRMRGDAVALHKPPGLVSGQPESRDQIPAVRLLTRANLFLREGDPRDEELRETLRGGDHLHFARRFGEGERGRDRRRGGDDGAPDLTKPDATLAGYAPAGRLDRDSSGLLIFTKCGVMAKKLVSSRGLIEKEYLVKVQPAQSLTTNELRDGMKRLPRPNRNLAPLLRGGRRLFGEPRPLRPLVEAEWVRSPNLRGADPGGAGILRLVLREGRKHQIRRMCRQILGMHATKLVRTRVGGVKLGTLPEGFWRPLREAEAHSIFFAGSDSGG